LKKLLYTLAAIIATQFSYAQSPAIQWKTTLGGSGSEYSYGIKNTPDSGYIIAGTGQSYLSHNNYGGYDAWVIKLSATGAVQWERAIGGSQDDVATQVIPTQEGGYIMVGTSSSADSDLTANHGDKDVWLVKLSATGAIEWQHSYGGSGSDEGMGIRQTPDSGYVIVASSTSSNGDVTMNHGGDDVWVFKVNAGGILQWQHSYGGSSDDYGASIVVADTGYVVACYGGSADGDVVGNHGGDDVWILKLDTSGAIQWQRSYGGTALDYPNEIIAVDSGYVLAGGTNSTDGDATGNHGNGDFWVVKVSHTGSLMWQRCFGGGANDEATGIAVTADGSLLVTGWINSNDGQVTGFHGSTDYWLAWLSPGGNLIHERALGGLGVDAARSVAASADGGAVVTGYSFYGGGDIGSYTDGIDMWVAKLIFSTEGIVNPASAQHICAPNPATSVVTITGITNATINVYNMAGQLVIETRNTNKTDVSKLPPAIYLLTATDDAGNIIYAGGVEKR
jgi:hypothetical protein